MDAGQECALGRVLVVDDHRDSADALAVLLRLAGNNVQVAYDAWTAVRTAQQFRPDMIVMDIWMPGMDGYQTAATIRAIPEIASTYIVACTALPHKEYPHGDRSVFDLQLQKPLMLSELEEILRFARRAAHTGSRNTRQGGPGTESPQ